MPSSLVPITTDSLILQQSNLSITITVGQYFSMVGSLQLYCGRFIPGSVAAAYRYKAINGLPNCLTPNQPGSAVAWRQCKWAHKSGLGLDRHKTSICEHGF